MTKLSLLLIPALAACATAAPEPAPAASPPAAAAMAPAGFPSGTYSTTIADADIPAGAPADMRTGLVGTWEIRLDGTGHALASFNGRQVVDAPFTLMGNVINFGEDSGEYACHSPARYNWHATATELHFSKIADTCDGRAIALTSHAWVRRP